MSYLSMTFACCVLLLSLTGSGTAQKAVILKKCTATFGEAIDKNLGIFPLDHDFVVSVEFTQKGKLKQIAVEPKYFFADAHPDWLEPKEWPHLLNQTPQALVSLIDSVSSLGNLKIKYSSPFITNSTAYRYECYENAVVTFADHWDWHGDPGASKVRFIRVNYGAKCKAAESAV